MKAYDFYGYGSVGGVNPAEDAPSWIRTPLDLYDALSDGLWREETCAPRMRDRWSDDNKTCGQCSITAFIVQDLFGGEVYGVPLEDGNYHCYNVVDGARFDLTSEQFGDKAKDLVYDDNYPQSRETHFAKAEKKERYKLLKGLVLSYQPKMNT